MAVQIWKKQARQLNDGVDIIVGTPGRVMDMTKRSHQFNNSNNFLP